jgi:hypothetical protein
MRCTARSQSRRATPCSSLARAVCPCTSSACLSRKECALTSGHSFGLQFARAAGAQVIALSSSKEKMDKARALGAHHVVNYREVPNWEEEVMKIVGVLRTMRLGVSNADRERRRMGAASTMSSRSAGRARSTTPSPLFATAGTST